MPSSSSGHMPENEDIIIRRATDSSGRYRLGTLQQPAQFLCVTHYEAMTFAAKYAKAHGVGVWQTDDDRTFTRVEETTASRLRP